MSSKKLIRDLVGDVGEAISAIQYQKGIEAKLRQIEAALGPRRWNTAARFMAGRNWPRRGIRHPDRNAVDNLERQGIECRARLGWLP